MTTFWEVLPWLIAMLLLIGCSGFFSASEAALFYLRPNQRRTLRQGAARERTASRLLEDPDRLLSAILFWNLVVNVSYFAISAMLSIRLEEMAELPPSFSWLFALASLLLIIFCSEMMPKTLAVLAPLQISRMVSIPLSFTVRLVDPLMPLLQSINLFSRRLIWPGFVAEQYLEIADLERAIVLSGADANLIKQEQTVLQNVVNLSDIRVDEWMRPRSQLVVHQPPLTLADLHGELPVSGYLLISEEDSDEIEKALQVDQLVEFKSLERLDAHAEPVLYLPWVATVADALEKMSKRDSDVTAVVNEYGDTVGILTVEDILESVFAYAPSRSQRLFDQAPLTRLDPNRWRISGMMSLKRLGRQLQVAYPDTFSVTVAGVIQEQLQRVAEPGDTCQFGPFHFEVVAAPRRANMVVEVSLIEAGEQAE